MQTIPDPLLAQPAIDEALFERMALALENQGYVILPTALPEPLLGSLLDCRAQLEAEAFHLARVGRGRDQTRNRFVRRNRIHWIGEEHRGSGPWLDWSRRLRLYLNRRLYLGLFSFESHFSLYETGDFYRKHVDAFKGESNRVLSLIVYLNKGWEPDQGGELVIYEPTTNAPLVKVVPAYGTVVLFLSEEFPHEVLPARRDRHAVAGWFRVNNSLNDALDPPR